MWGKTGSKLYGARSGADYIDNHKRFTLFCKAAIESVKVLPFGPGEDCVFVANDWHSGLVPLLIKVRASGGRGLCCAAHWWPGLVKRPPLLLQTRSAFACLRGLLPSFRGVTARGCAGGFPELRAGAASQPPCRHLMLERAGSSSGALDDSPHIGMLIAAAGATLTTPHHCHH